MFPPSDHPKAPPVGALETSRLVAVVLLVLYHVIGPGSDAGLKLPDTHPARMFADYFADLRMPLFAFIAGHVYGLRPVDPAQWKSFLAGKFRRLAVPGAVAITVFMLLALMLHLRFAPDADWWRNYVMPYAHFWFLQAILLIFVVFGTFDTFGHGRGSAVILALSILWTMSGWRLQTNIMAANHALYLLPYFVVGVMVARQRSIVFSNRLAIILMAVTVVALTTWINILDLQETGRFSQNRRDLQSLAFGISGSMLCYLVLPRIDSRVFGSFAFTIYLYHVLGTSGMRRLLYAIGIDDTGTHLIAGLVAGLAVPVMLHIASLQSPAATRLVLGQRPNPPRHKIAEAST
ncbi:acyltransferase family protein [Paracoccus beibuensis]|uniref:acyltransferase family protein n=1 Tax=Paracoccus beibuensis TaxID=547602 RepID=UPI00223EA214|nr:acyltransferase [Paracoccus beibuensis]